MNQNANLKKSSLLFIYYKESSFLTRSSEIFRTLSLIRYSTLNKGFIVNITNKRRL